MKYYHEPVMLSEVIDILKPKNDKYFLDCTLGGAGYTLAIAEKLSPEGRVVSLDLDPWSIKNAEEIIKERKIGNISLVQDNFKNLKEAVVKVFGSEERFDGIVFDLGLSLAQLEDENRGFSFKRDSLIDMSFQGENNKGDSSQAGYILNNYPIEQLLDIFNRFGEEKLSLRIAKNIEKRRREKSIKTTGRLSEIIEEAIPGRFFPYKDNIKARIFQALRIAVNQELESLKQALPQALELLKKEGKIVVISYHSLEDRLVKNFFQKESRSCLCSPQVPECRCSHQAKLEVIKNKKEKGKSKNFLTPGSEELRRNPRSRSAKLRAAKKII